MNQFVNWSGYIFYKKATLKGYHLYWGMLMRESASGLKRINLYEKQAQSLVNPISVGLIDALSVKAMEGKGRSNSHRYEFQIMATSGKHQFATRTEEECRKWMEKLDRILHGPPEPGIVYEFQLKVMPTSHSDKLALVGYYVMQVTEDTVVLYTSSGIIPTGFRCELAHITKVQHTYITGGEYNFPLLTIQTSSHAKIGEGGFAFSARSAADIAAVIEHRRSQPATKPQKASKPLVTDLEVPTRHHQQPLPPRQNRTSQELRENQVPQPLVTDLEVPTRHHQQPLPPRQNRTSQELREKQVPQPLVTDSEVPTRHHQQPLPPRQNRTSQELREKQVPKPLVTDSEVPTRHHQRKRTSQELREEHFKTLAPSLALLHTLHLPNQAKPNDQKTGPDPSQNPKLQCATTSVAPPAQKSPLSVKSESPPLVLSSDSLPASVKPHTRHKPPVMPKPPVTPKSPMAPQRPCSTSPLPPSTSPRHNFDSLQAQKSESLLSGEETPSPSLSNALPRPLRDCKSQPIISSVPNNTDKRYSWMSVGSEEFENPESWIIKEPLDLRSRPERSSLEFVSSPPSQNSGVHWQDVERGQDCSSLDQTRMSRWVESSTKPHPLPKEASYIRILPFPNQNTFDSKGKAVSPKAVRELPEGRVMQRQSTVRRAKSEESLDKSTDIPQGDHKGDFDMDSFELQVNPAYGETLPSSLTISPYAILRVETTDGSPYSTMYTNNGDILYADEDSTDSRPPACVPVVGEIAGDELYVDCYLQSEDVSYDYIQRSAFYKGRRERKAATYIDTQRSGYTPEEGTSQSERGQLPSLERRQPRIPPRPPPPYGQTRIPPRPPPPYGQTIIK